MFESPMFEFDESTPGSLPAIPLIARFGLPDRRKRPPVRPRREAASKYLMYMALLKIARSNFGAESTIQPVLPAFTGVGEIAGVDEPPRGPCAPTARGPPSPAFHGGGRDPRQRAGTGRSRHSGSNSRADNIVATIGIPTSLCKVMTDSGVKLDGGDRQIAVFDRHDDAILGFRADAKRRRQGAAPGVQGVVSAHREQTSTCDLAFSGD